MGITHRHRTVLVLAAIIWGCGQEREYDNPVDPKNTESSGSKSSSPSGDTDTPSGATTNTPTTSSGQTAQPGPAKSKALKFTDIIELSDVSSIISAVMKDGKIHLSAKDKKNEGFLGIQSANNEFTRTYFNLMATDVLKLSNGDSYRLADGLTAIDNLYMFLNYGRIPMRFVEVDKTTLKPIREVRYYFNQQCETGCNCLFKDGDRWNSIDFATWQIFGMLDGALISTSTLKHPVTGKSATLGPCTYDGQKFYSVDSSNAKLQVAAKGWSSEEFFSLSGFSYLNNARFLPDGTGKFVVVGCASSKCVKANAAFVDQ